MGLDGPPLQRPPVTRQFVLDLINHSEAPLPNRSLMFRWASLGFQKLVISCKSCGTNLGEILFRSTFKGLGRSAGGEVCWPGRNKTGPCG